MLSAAQELRIVEGPSVTVDDPEAYRAYYGKLAGEEHVYHIESADPFRLSVVILTPNVEGARTDFSAAVYDKIDTDEPVIVLDGTVSEWQWFFDTAGRDEYLAGPVLRGGLPQGAYEVRVSNPDNQGAYVLVLGEDSWFSNSGLISRYSALPTIKTEFFGKPASQAYVTPLLMWPVIALLIVITIIVFALYIVRRRRAPAEIAI
ncbi:MAG TPA: hypothetical protein VNM40_02265 [Candidatus Paceibacterota bacterium]|nr:hypothetical protein [Candidatus Paceibacterota bacterium]